MYEHRPILARANKQQRAEVEQEYRWIQGAVLRPTREAKAIRIHLVLLR